LEAKTAELATETVRFRPDPIIGFAARRAARAVARLCLRAPLNDLHCPPCFANLARGTAMRTSFATDQR
jgi:hypothetical protein